MPEFDELPIPRKDAIADAAARAALQTALVTTAAVNAAVASVRYLLQSPSTGWPARPTGAGPVFYFGWTEPSGLQAADLWFPIAEQFGESPPEAFTVGQWSVAPTGETGEIGITITELPGSFEALTSIEYRIDEGAAVALSGATTGTYTVSGLTDDVEVDVQIRALNSEGAGDWSDVKAVTPLDSIFGVEWLDGDPDPYGNLEHLAQNSDGTVAVADNNDPVGWAENTI
jgi:hypothetical protein